MAIEHMHNLQALEELLKGLSGQRIGMAVSGGTDSRLLAYTLDRLKLPFTAVHCTGPHLSSAETAYAQSWLARKGIRHMIIRFNPLSLPAVQTNGPDRCYHCKHALFSSIINLYGAETIILEGSNKTDCTEYRPGRQALKELGIRSPFIEAGISKDDIRSIARETGLDWPDQPSRPCLLTRFAYGLTPDETLLSRVGNAEDKLADLGLSGFRLRIVTPEKTVLQIPVVQKSLAHSALDTVKSLLAMDGFSNVEIVYTECISGYYDKANKQV